MLGKIIISILFIPINALILWVASILVHERQDYNIALIATVLIFIISLLELIPFSGHYAIVISTIAHYVCWIITFIILKLLYGYEWVQTIILWFVWVTIQFPINLIQNKILTLPWDNLIQCF